MGVLIVYVILMNIRIGLCGLIMALVVLPTWNDANAYFHTPVHPTFGQVFYGTGVILCFLVLCIEIRDMVKKRWK